MLAIYEDKQVFVVVPLSLDRRMMTESEVIQFLRIPDISNSKNYHNVIEHLKKFRGLPRIHICRKALYPKKSILEWMGKETYVGK